MLNIRFARKDEIADLQDLNNEVFIDNQKYDPDLVMNWAESGLGKKYFSNLLNNINACCLIAEMDGKKVGYIAAAEKKMDYLKTKYLEIENMGVIPSYRSKGIGSLLMQNCINWAKKKGFKKVYVSSYFENEKAVKFYKNNGFSEFEVGLEKLI